MIPSSYRLREIAGLLVLAVLAAAAVLVATQALSTNAQANSGSSGTATPSQVSSTAVEDGRQLFLSDCASCHGTNAQGSNVAPSLHNAGPATVDFYLRTGRMPLGQLGVPAWQQQRSPLTSAQIQALEAYLGTVGTGPAIPNVVASAGDLHRGWELFINNCAACHSATGAGGSIGTSLSAPPLSRADAQTVAEAVLIGPGAMPRFSFSQADVNALARYVEYLHNKPDPGGVSVGVGPVPEGLLAGVLGLGLLILVTRWVVGRKGQGAPAEPLPVPVEATPEEPASSASSQRRQAPWPGDSA